tara:strand:+ start:331 stop:549 length:219 start_codon:yes stop_codon:yes gene_type:complete
MNLKEKLDAIAEILEVDLVKEEDVLSNFSNWDSMAVLGIMSLLEENDSNFDFSGEQIAECIAVKDILKLMEN